jgi:hypothetical protein
MSTPRARILEMIVDQETPAGLDLWPAIQAGLNRPDILQGSARGQRTGRAWRGALASGLAVILLLMSTLAIYPPTRAWAQDALNGLLAAFHFDTGQRATPVARVAGSAGALEPVTPDDCVPDEQGRSICFPEFGHARPTLEQARAEAGFTPRLPAYLPAGYQDQGGFTVSGTTISWDARLDGATCPTYITLAQSPASGSTMGAVAIGEAQATPVSVGPIPGVWVASVPKEKACRAADDGKSAHSVAYDQDVLAWEQDGIRYWLFGDAGLGLDEMLKVAESLR